MRAAPRIYAYVLGTAALAALSIVLWLSLPERVSDEREALRLTELKNIAVARLEAGEFEESARLFVQISERLPDDPLGPRNLAIARLLAVRASAAEDRAAAARRAQDALEGLREREPESGVRDFLAARLAMQQGQPRIAFDALARAVRASPEDAGLWYELYSVARDARERDEEARAALEEAYSRAPDNLAVLVDWLSTRSERREAGIVSDLEAARQLLAPFSETIREFTKVDLHTVLESAASAARDGDWPAVDARVRTLVNVLRPELAVRLDRKRLLHHELDYALSEFSSDRFAGIDLSGRMTTSPIAVELVRVSGLAQLPQRRGVRAAKLVDFDLDGRLDVVVVLEGAVEVLGATPEGWSSIAELALATRPAGVLVADLDRDTGRARLAGCETADSDLVLYGPDGVQVLENRVGEEGSVLRVVDQSPAFEAMRGVTSGALADLDHDGDLDLVAATESGVTAWVNTGDFRFADISDRSSLPGPGTALSALIPVDWNRTVDLDVVVAAEAGDAALLENHRHGRFRWRALGAGFESLAGAKGLALGDLDGNVSWDLVGAGARGLSVTLTRTPEPGRVQALRAELVSDVPWEGVATWDYDNDGHQDLIAWGPAGLAAWRGGAEAAFERADALFADDLGTVSGVDVGDIDGDGDLDVLAIEAGGVGWFSNEGGNANHSLSIDLSGQRVADQKDERVNIHGLGSLLELRAGPLYQARVVDRPRTHFGLGERSRADVARVLWTNGIAQVEMQPSAGAALCEVQDLKGSCPYLYAWNGSRFAFVTDLLWAAPIGLQSAEYRLAPTRAWEYLKISGHALTPVDGEYRLRVTEELWEAAYFDQIHLIAVDHPAEVEIYTNEKVGPGEMAAFHLHTVRDPRTPLTARDHRGRNVLGEVSERDGRYLEPFDRRIVQGLGERHFLEVDLGELPDASRIVLFLTGWIVPTDTSLNIALSQNPSLDPPRPPSLWVPDEAGEWREVMPFMGFPGGKTKTIAVDLSNAFLTDDFRVRIESTAEIYWDHVFFTVDEEQAAFTLTDLELVQAELDYRGFSQRIEGRHFGPESYDYTRVSTAPKWPPMPGPFTPYGDVSALIRDADDRLLVMGAGDDVALRFRVPGEEVPPGWTRDFILHNVGWDKDADLNTVYGHAVEPLPYGAMSGYPDSSRRNISPVAGREQLAMQFWHRLRKPSLP